MTTIWIELAKVLAIIAALTGGTFFVTTFLCWALTEDAGNEGASQTKGQCL